MGEPGEVIFPSRPHVLSKPGEPGMCGPQGFEGEPGLPGYPGSIGKVFWSSQSRPNSTISLSVEVCG